MTDITALLLKGGSEPDLDAVFQRVYPELKRLAHARLASSGGSKTLSATALVNEAYLKLVQSERLSVESRRHFFACVGRAMRQIVVDYARGRQAIKRGGEITLVNDPGVIEALGEADTAESLLALEQALQALSSRDPRLVRLIEYRVFAGLEQADIAELLEMSRRTVQRDWLRARIWISEALES